MNATTMNVETFKYDNRIVRAFSIITVVYNGESLLPGTLDSVRRQTWPHIEHIVCLGRSWRGDEGTARNRRPVDS